MKLDIYARVHTENPSDPAQGENGKNNDPPRLPPSALVVDTETREGLGLELEFGCYAYCEPNVTVADGSYEPCEQGIFYRDNLEPEFVKVIRQYALDHPELKLRVRTRTDFVKNVLWPTLRAGGAVVGLNLGFDLSRISVCHSNMRNGRGFSFFTRDYVDKKTGREKPSLFTPPITRISIDSKKSFYGVGFSLASDEEKAEFRQARFADLRTLAFSLTNQGHSLESLCDEFDAPADVAKLKYVPGPITPEKIDYCRRDVKATLWALNTLAAEFLRHPIQLPIDNAYSPVSLGKSYLKEMNILPPKQKLAIPPDIQGAAMEAFYAGRAETNIRKCEMPVMYLDFSSQYPSVFHLLRCQEILIAESLTFEPCTAEVQAFLDALMPGHMFQPDIWSQQLRFFAQVIPDGNVLPVRAKHNGQTANIGFNHFVHDQPVFYTGLELAAAKILGNGKASKVVRAFRVVPHGVQKGLSSVLLRGEVPIDPLKDDLARKIVESRARVKKTNRPLANFLKVMANGGLFYGLFAQVSPERQEEAVEVQVFTGDEVFASTTNDIEKTGDWYCPLVAGLITSGGHLLLASAERLLADAGGSYVFMDTDSVAVVSSEHSGLIPCPGGPHRMPDGRETVRALSWEETIEKVVKPFDQLHPYDRRAVKDHFLKVDEANFDSNGHQRQLYAFSISSKRYCLYTYAADGKRVIVKVSAHGLGYLMPSFDDPPEARKAEGREEHKWIYEAWEWILARELDGEAAARHYRKPWFEYPAMMPLAVTTPHVIKRLKHMPWARPMNFMNAPIIAHALLSTEVDAGRFTLVGPYNENPETWGDATYFNLHDGRPYRIGIEPGAIPCLAYGSILQSYRLHPESKFLGPDGAPCGPDTRGVLHRMTVEGGTKWPLRKESNRRWAEGNDLSLIEDDEGDPTGKEFKRDGKPSYHHTKQPLPAEVREWLKTLPLKRVGRVLSIDRNILRRGRDGKPVARSTRNKLLLLFRLTKRGLNLLEGLKAIRLQEVLQVSETR